jgi:hypothetical protein
VMAGDGPAPPGEPPRASDSLDPAGDGARASGVVSLGEIRRAETVIDALAARRGVPSGATRDPVVRLLAALTHDVDAPGFRTAGPAGKSALAGDAGRARMPSASRSQIPSGGGPSHSRPPRGGPPRGEPPRQARRAPTRALVTGLVAAAAVLLTAIVTSPRWPGTGGRGPAPLAVSLQPAAQAAGQVSGGGARGLPGGARGWPGGARGLPVDPYASGTRAGARQTILAPRGTGHAGLGGPGLARRVGPAPARRGPALTNLGQAAGQRGPALAGGGGRGPVPNGPALAGGGGPALATRGGGGRPGSASGRPVVITPGGASGAGPQGDSGLQGSSGAAGVTGTQGRASGRPGALPGGAAGGSGAGGSGRAAGRHGALSAGPRVGSGAGGGAGGQGGRHAGRRSAGGAAASSGHVAGAQPWQFWMSGSGMSRLG